MSRSQLVVIGTSLGGMDALSAVFGMLPKNFPAPILVVIHRSKESTETVILMLQRITTLKVVEPTDKQSIVKGYIYVAPADYHLLVEDMHRALSVDEPVCNARPSIDVLFESAADEYAENVIGVILTGASKDGVNGLAAIKSNGGISIVQDPSTAESKILPEAVISAMTVDHIVPLDEIGKMLVELVSG